MKRNGILLIILFFCSGVIFAEINPNALRHFNEGMNYYNRNDFDSAIVEFSNAIAISPEYADAYLERGNCYDNKDDQENALENYLKAGEYEKNIQFLLMRMNVHLMMYKNMTRQLSRFPNALIRE
jgi:tetratricopeptide (TPR) repeat protein